MITGTGTVAMRPWPHQVKAGGKPEIGPPPEKSSAAPRKAVSPPRVTTKGGTRRRVMTSPCSSPPAMPTAIAAAAARITGLPAASAAPIAKRSARPPFST